MRRYVFIDIISAIRASQSTWKEAETVIICKLDSRMNKWRLRFPSARCRLKVSWCINWKTLQNFGFDKEDTSIGW